MIYLRDSAYLALKKDVKALLTYCKIIQNMGIHGSIAGKIMTRIICFDFITTATTPILNQ